jgi:uncharacterized membrane protein
MAVIDTAITVVHLLVGAVWVGSAVFVAVGVLPLARTADIDATAFASMTGTLTTTTRASAVIMFLTGGHLAGTRYTAETLTGSTNGHLVLGMLALWLAFTALLEIGRSRMADGLDRGKLREPARAGTPFYRAAALVGVLLLVDAGLLLT